MPMMRLLKSIMLWYRTLRPIQTAVQAPDAAGKRRCMNPVLYFLESLSFLDWGLLAAVLAVVDVFVPKPRLVIPAIAAGMVGFVLMLLPQLGWPWQLGGFVLLSIFGAAILLARRLHRRQQHRMPLYPAGESAMTSFHDFSVKTIDGRDKSLKDFKGRTLLLVNVASECGQIGRASCRERV